MGVQLRRITTADDPALPSIMRLGRRNARFLGFMPKGGYTDRARKGTLLVAVEEDRVAGYLLYDLPRSVIRVTHVCVDGAYRQQGIARRLIDEVSKRHADRRGVELVVRNDFPAFDMWYRLGFAPVRELPGKGAASRLKTVMWRDHGEPDLLSWSADTTAGFAVVVDASVFYDLHPVPGRAADPATPELADAVFSGELELVVTPELEREIARHKDPAVRSHLRRMCVQYRHTAASTDEIGRLATEMASDIEASQSDRRLSAHDHADLRYAAAAVASGVGHVLTKDSPFSQWGRRALSHYGVRLLDPRAALIKLDESARSSSYSPRALHGTALQRALVGAEALPDVRDTFLNKEAGERRAAFHQVLHGALTRPGAACHYIADSGELLALWSTRLDGSDLLVDVLRVNSLARLAPSIAEQLSFMLRDSARQCGSSRVLVGDPSPTRLIKAALRRGGFDEVPGGFMAATPAQCQDRRAWARQLGRAQETRGAAQLLTATRVCAQERDPTAPEVAEFERLLWPAKMSDGPLPTFLVPIKQVWSSRLFGVPESLEVRPTALGLSREHVYYRAPRPAIVAAPARVLWYATQGRGSREPAPPGVFACSRLEEVTVDAPNVLHARFAHLGVYKRQHVFEAAEDGKAQAMRVMDTELFGAPLGLDRLKELAAESCQTLHLRSPQRVGADLFGAIYREGAYGHGGR